jgi:cyclopropane-fatty-acyl-phospholipid synthase
MNAEAERPRGGSKPSRHCSRTSARSRRSTSVSCCGTVVARYIFPGGQLDHLGMSIANLERHGSEVHDVEAWREHYARTTRLWHDRLSANRAPAEREVGAVKTRLWMAYLAGVSMGFTQNSVGVFQTLASKRTRGPSGLPPSRAHLYR